MHFHWSGFSLCHSAQCPSPLLSIIRQHHLHFHASAKAVQTRLSLVVRYALDLNFNARDCVTVGNYEENRFSFENNHSDLLLLTGQRVSSFLNQDYRKRSLCFRLTPGLRRLAVGLLITKRASNAENRVEGWSVGISYSSW